MAIQADWRYTLTSHGEGILQASRLRAGSWLGPGSVAGGKTLTAWHREMLRDFRQRIRPKTKSDSLVWKALLSGYHRWAPHGLRLQHEIAYWESALAEGRRDPWMDEAINPLTRRSQFPELLIPCVLEMRKPNGSVRVLDVGCGPLSPLAWGAEQGLFELTAIDPLARDYVDLLERYGIEYPVKPVKLRGEKLLKHFPASSFDIVYSRNALDHAANVSRCIDQIHGVLKSGGFFFLEGLVCEGTHNRWRGLHDHDLVIMGGQLMHFDRVGRPTRLAASFTCVYQDQKSAEPGGWFRILFRK